VGTLELELACAASLRAPPPMLPPASPDGAGPSLRLSGPPALRITLDQPLSWCRSLQRVHGGPRANPSPMRIETQRGTGVVVFCRARR
jgi:hypothetical protein